MRVGNALALSRHSKQKKTRHIKGGAYAQEHPDEFKDDELEDEDELPEEQHYTVLAKNQEYLDALEKQEKEYTGKGYSCPRCCCKWCNDPRRPYCLAMVQAEEVGGETRTRIVRRNCVRFNVFWIRLTFSWLFDALVLLAILTATGLIGARTYAEDEDSPLAHSLDNADLVITAVFIIEIVTKMLALGPFIYFKMWWNIFDFFIVAVDFFPLPINVVVFRLLRLLRIAKLIKAFPDLQVILIGLQQGMKSIFYNSVLLLLMMWVFAIMGMIMFRANDPFHFGTLHNSLFTLFRVATLEDWTDVMYINIHGCGETNYGYPEKADVNNSNPLTGRGPVAEAYEYNTPCEHSSGKGFWATLYFVVYVVIAGLVMLSIFIGVVTSAMDDATAKIGEEKRVAAMKKAAEEKEKLLHLQEEMTQLLEEPKAGCKKKCAICCFSCKTCVVTWFDGLALEDDRALMFENNLDSAHLQAARAVAAACESKVADVIIMITILVAAICAGLEVSDLDNAADTLATLEIVILTIFLIEFLAKLFGEGTAPWRYFREPMNLFDFSIVVVCMLSLVLSSGTGDYQGSTGGVESGADTGAYSALRLFRLLRLLKLLDGIPRLRIIVTGVYRGLSSIAFIFALLMLVFYIYAILGLSFFAKNDPWHFKNLHTAMLTLFRASTFEDWTDIYYINYYGCDYWGYEGGLADPDGRGWVTIQCTDSKSQGAIATLYFVSFIFVAAFIMLSLFVGVVTTSMFEAQQDMAIKNALAELQEKLILKFPEELTQKKMRYFRRLFDALDVDRSGYLTMPEIQSMVSSSSLMWSKAMRERLIDGVDLNDDGVIDFAEFVVMVLAADRGISAATLMHEIIITTGRVQLRLEWHPTRPPQIKFTVTVFEARGLKKMDLIGDNDTYVLVTVDGVTLRTLTISGRTPSWEGEEGEEGEEGVEGQQLVFYVDALPDHFEVRLFDEDESSNDDQIGMAVIDTLTTMIGADHKKEWAQLTYHGEACRACGCGKAAEAGTTKAGEVLLGVEATELEAEADDAIGRLKVTTLQGSHLKSMDAIGKNDVYAAITVPVGVHDHEDEEEVPTKERATMDADEFSSGGTDVYPVTQQQTNPVMLKDVDPDCTKRTPTVDEGGDDPVWLGGGATVSFERKVIPHWVTVRVLDEDEGVMNNDDHIGTAIVEFDHLPNNVHPPTGAEHWELVAWFDLFCEPEGSAPTEEAEDVVMEGEQVEMSSALIGELEKKAIEAHRVSSSRSLAPVPEDPEGDES